jgi:hypothetical protein
LFTGLAAAFTAHGVFRRADGAAMQPCREREALRNAARLVCQLHKYLLRNVLSQVRVAARDPAGRPQHQRCVSPDKRAKRRLLPGGGK